MATEDFLATLIKEAKKYTQRLDQVKHRPNSQKKNKHENYQKKFG